MRVREGAETDLPFLVELEAACFAVHRRSTRRSLQRSLRSEGQLVYVVEPLAGGPPVGAAVLICYKQALRLYSIAVMPDKRGSGAGHQLMQRVLEEARVRGCERVTLEADAHDAALLGWYRRYGFQDAGRVTDYYASGEDASRMVCILRSGAGEAWSATDNIIVVDRLDRWPMIDVPGVTVITADDYLTGERYRNSERFHVLNLCGSYKGHTIGYYV